MTPALTALGNALRDLFAPRILTIVLLPMLGALAIWLTLSWLFWDDWTHWLNQLGTGTAAGQWLEGVGAGWLIHALAALGIIVLLVPVTLVTAMIIAEVVAMPVIVALVGGRYFAGLEKRRGGTVGGSILNTAIAIGIFALLWIVTLPLWLFGIFALVLPVLLSAYLNQRLFRYDALADFAAADEYRQVLARAKGSLYGLGLLLAALYYVPVFNLVVPVLSGLAFTHLCLGELQRLRAGARGSA
jgi:CysZ protein